ncbi:MAG: PIN domain-containing protein [Cyclobacteriaceae bacterium]
MIIADTSVWIEYLRKTDPDVSSMLKSYLKRDDVFIVSAIVGELLQGVKSKRERQIIELIWESLPKANESNCFIQAGNLSNKYRLYAKGVGLIDSYLLAACLKNNLALWTLDKKLLRAYDEMVG